jgi:hypothetical protein
MFLRVQNVYSGGHSPPREGTSSAMFLRVRGVRVVVGEMVTVRVSVGGTVRVRVRVRGF